MNSTDDDCDCPLCIFELKIKNSCLWEQNWNQHWAFYHLLLSFQFYWFLEYIHETRVIFLVQNWRIPVIIEMIDELLDILHHETMPVTRNPYRSSVELVCVGKEKTVYGFRFFNRTVSFLMVRLIIWPRCGFLDPLLYFGICFFLWCFVIINF